MLQTQLSVKVTTRTLHTTQVNVPHLAINLVTVSLHHDSSKTEHSPPEFGGISEVF